MTDEKNKEKRNQVAFPSHGTSKWENTGCQAYAIKTSLPYFLGWATSLMWAHVHQSKNNFGEIEISILHGREWPMFNK